ncbi:MAG: hypothetical protein WDO14_01240 [Bacteroidota bacterium]
MKIHLSVVAVLLSATAFAQTITYESVDITNPENTDWPSKYPIFKSVTKPQAAETLNIALQIADFKKCNTKKNPKAIQADMDHAWNFTVSRPTPRLIQVTTVMTILAFGMQVSPYDNVFVYYFDAETGDRLYPYSFFKNGTFIKTRDLAISGLLKAMLKRKKELLNEHADMDPTELFESDYDKGCEDEILQEWDFETVKLNFTKDAIVFIVHDCENGIPRRTHELFTTSVPLQSLKSYLSPVYDYYLNNGPKPAIDYVDHIFRGTIGTNIPVTIMLRRIKESTALTGYEVYDNHGVAIELKGDLTTKNVYFDEIDGDQTLATYFIEVKGDVLTGTWTKADNSKTLPVKATIPH